MFDVDTDLGKYVLLLIKLIINSKEEIGLGVYIYIYIYIYTYTGL